MGRRVCVVLYYMYIYIIYLLIDIRLPGRLHCSGPYNIVYRTQNISPARPLCARQINDVAAVYVVRDFFSVKVPLLYTFSHSVLHTKTDFNHFYIIITIIYHYDHNTNT